MPNRKKKEDIFTKILEEFDKARPVEEVLADFTQEDLERDPEFVADYQRSKFVEQILHEMDAQGFNKKTLAEKLGKTRQYLTKILNEDSEANFTIQTLAELCCALDRDLDIRIYDRKAKTHKQGRGHRMDTHSSYFPNSRPETTRILNLSEFKHEKSSSPLRMEPDAIAG